MLSYFSWALPEDYSKEDPCNFLWDRELARNWPRVGQLLNNSECVQNLTLAIWYCFFLLPRAHTKSGWLKVDQELDMGCQLLTRTFPCWNCRGLSCSSPLATPNSRRQFYSKMATQQNITQKYPAWSTPKHSLGKHNFASTSRSHKKITELIQKLFGSEISLKFPEHFKFSKVDPGIRQSTAHNY